MTSTSPLPIRHAPARRRNAKRRGVAVAEFAVIVPVLVLVVFGGLSIAHVITLKHSTKHLVDGAAFAVMRGDTSFAEIKAHYQGQAESVGLTGFELLISQQPGDMVRLTGLLPVSPNNPLRGFTTMQQVEAEAVVYAPQGDDLGLSGGDDDDDDDD